MSLGARFLLGVVLGTLLAFAAAVIVYRELKHARPVFVMLEPKAAPTKILSISTETLRTFQSTYPSRLSITCRGGEIVVDLKTGAVTTPLGLPESGRRFWAAVAEAFPDARQAIVESNPKPTKTK